MTVLALTSEIANTLPASISSRRELPFNIEVEQALLGAVLLNIEAFDRVSDFLREKHFYEKIHQKIYEICARLIAQGKSSDPKIVRAFFSPDQRVGEISVSDYILRLSLEAITIINVVDYAHIIYNCYIRRELINIGEAIVNTAYESDLDLDSKDQVEQAEHSLFNLIEKGSSNTGPQQIKQAMSDALTMANSAFKRAGGLSGIPTGISDLDKKMGGLQKSDLIILAGRPGMGKTSLATNIAFNIASSYNDQTNLNDAEISGGIVGFFSLEMSSEQLATRIISEQAEISSSKIRRGDLTQTDFDKLAQCAHSLSQLPFYIDQTGGISISQLATRARRLKRQFGLDVLIIDYIQLMTSGRKDNGNRVQEITEITTGLKALAKELHVPIIALSQLSRQVENREDKRPQLSDLRESGSIEQDADVVLFVFREEYYLQNSEPKEDSPEYSKWKMNMDLAKGKAEVLISKQRHGPTGTVKLAFQSAFTRFSNFANDDYLPTHRS